MTAEARRAFLSDFAASYDLPGAAKRAGIGREAAYGLLAGEEARAELDRLICERAEGETLARIRREYERMAFDGGEEVRAADRLRALEQLRLIASSAVRDGGAPSLVIRCEYV